MKRIISILFSIKSLFAALGAGLVLCALSAPILMNEFLTEPNFLLYGLGGILFGLYLTVVMSVEFFNNKEDTYVSFLGYACFLVVLILGFAGVYLTGDFIPGEEFNFRYMNAIYFSTVTWTTLGYGDIQPVGIYKLVAAAEAIFGYIFMALLMGKVLVLLQGKSKLTVDPRR
jgi:hypothetical protein